MRCLSKKRNKEFKEIYKFDNGIIIKIPQYKKTSFYIGDKKEAKEKGFEPRGRNSFYSINNDTIVKEGYVAEKTNDRIIIIGEIQINKNNFEEINKIILQLLSGEIDEYK